MDLHLVQEYIIYTTIKLRKLVQDKKYFSGPVSKFYI
ncbi:hypothetical protein PAU_02141 [Photorhabdus asymbiotica]|uniref:Uncharacterized protein n=1 Tax=Photorhabdus asymbiotica subsp. asymbiotica (strain ATCC 43949 / 3105-77) TaxID=553480 RepID=C7BJZ3_PHOAA|nr:hypothetical protein PAU_02141 [Photorhabdus asymbiotica]